MIAEENIVTVQKNKKIGTENFLDHLV